MFVYKNNSWTELTILLLWQPVFKYKKNITNAYETVYEIKNLKVFVRFSRQSVGVMMKKQMRSQLALH